MKPTIFPRFLKALGVPHTATYSDMRFNTMTFSSLFGFSHLLSDYGIPSKAYLIEDKNEFSKLTPPFLAQTTSGVFTIVEAVDTEVGTVTYDSMGAVSTVPLATFEKAWNGIVLLAFPSSASAEPDWRNHRLQEIVASATRWVLGISVLGVIAYFFVSRGLWRHVSTCLLTVFDCVGIYLSYLLMQKTLGIHTAAGDRVCGVLEKGGCDDVLSLKVSKLFGVISWSEVGMGYFSVSLATLLVFPHLWGALALFNLCCLPYTVWSITYQKFKAKRWCTLCVGVQSTLWLLFFCYLGGGWIRHILPLRLDYAVLLGTYVGAVLLLNLFSTTFRRLKAQTVTNENNT